MVESAGGRSLVRLWWPDGKPLPGMPPAEPPPEICASASEPQKKVMHAAIAPSHLLHERVSREGAIARVWASWREILKSASIRIDVSISPEIKWDELG